MKKRAENQARTRERIVETAMKLHEELGVRDTTISEIAERAGVERLTVYRHFPDEPSLLRACSRHWSELNPMPLPATWTGIGDPAVRTRFALGALYAYYRRTEAMWSSVLRDEKLPAVHAALKDARSYLKSLAGDLIGAWQPEARQRGRLAAAVSHSTRFYTWRSLKTEGLKDAEIAELMVLWFAALERPGKKTRSYS